MENVTTIDTLEVIRKSVIKSFHEMKRQPWNKGLKLSRKGETRVDKLYLDLLGTIDKIMDLVAEYEEKSEKITN